MEKPETPVAERVKRLGPLDASPALRQALDALAAEDEDLERRLRRVREDRAHVDQIAEEQQRKKQRRAMPGGARAPKGPEDDYGESSGDEEEEDPPPPPSSPTERATEALSPSGDGAEPFIDYSALLKVISAAINALSRCGGSGSRSVTQL